MISSSSTSSSSDTVYDCLSFDGEVIGDAPLCDGGVDGRSLVEVGDEGDAGLRKGEERGLFRKDDLYHQPPESIQIEIDTYHDDRVCSRQSYWSGIRGCFVA
jgi:hypothetical protein